MLPNEQKALEDIPTPYNKYAIPLVWATSIVKKAREEDRIKHDLGACQINGVSDVTEIGEMR